MIQPKLPAQAPRIQIVFTCPKCAKQNIVAYEASKIECKNCYQSIIAPIFEENIPIRNKF